MSLSRNQPIGSRAEQVTATRAVIRDIPAQGVAAKLAYAAKRPLAILSSVGVLLRLERLNLELGEGPEADLMAKRLGRPVLGVVGAGRIGASVLRIPSDPQEHLRGRSKQALRTNVSKARAAGVEVHPVPDRDFVLCLHAPDGSIQSDQLLTFSELRRCSVWLNAYHEGRLVGQTIAAVDGEWAVLEWAMRDPSGSDEASVARYLLHLELVATLIGRGVLYLADNGQPWRLSEGLFYHQKLLGFEICSVRVTRPGRHARSAASRARAAARGALTRSVRGRLEPGALDTAEEVSSQELGHTDPEHLHYVQSRLRFFHLALKRRHVSPEDVFLDLGCGKGRILYAAARMPFRRVIGVDISPELVEIARTNLARNESDLVCSSIEVSVADVTSYDIPDDVSVVYMFNPFTGSTFHRAMANVVASLDRHPRRLRIIYANPVMHDAVVSTDRFRQVRRWRDPRAPGDLLRTITVYESTAPGSRP